MRRALLFLVLAAAVRGQDAESHYQRARDLLKVPEKIDAATLDRATEELKAALRLQPGYVDARIEMGRIQVIRRQYDAAVQTASDVLNGDPGNLQAQLLRANALVGMGKPGVARLFLQDTLKTYPGNADVLFNLGAAEMADSRHQEAEDTFRTLWKADPSEVRALRGIALSLIARDQTPRALETVRAECARLPDRRDIRALVGEIELQAGDNRAAVETFQALVQTSEKPAALEYAQLGLAYRRTGDFKLAAEALRKAVAAGPGEIRFLPLYAEVLDASGDKKGAEKIYREAIGLDPKNPILLNNLAWLLADTGGDLKDALGLVQRARQAAPSSLEILDTVGWVYLKSNMAAEAADLFDQITNRNTTNPVYRYHLALALAAKGEKERALREAKRALEDKPGPADLAGIQELIRKLEGAKP